MHYNFPVYYVYFFLTFFLKSFSLLKVTCWLAQRKKSLFGWFLKTMEMHSKLRQNGFCFFLFLFFFKELLCALPSEELRNFKWVSPQTIHQNVYITTTAFCLHRDLETTHLSAQQTRNRGKKIYCQTLFNVLNTWSSLSSDFKRPSGEDIFEAVRKVTEWH